MMLELYHAKSMYVVTHRVVTVMISAQNAYTSPCSQSCSDFVSNLHIATLCDWSRFRNVWQAIFVPLIRCHEWCGWRLGWLAKGPVLPAPSRSILERPEKRAPFCCLDYIGDEQLPSYVGIIS